MPAYAYRYRTEPDGKKYFAGLAVAANLLELFWCIDEFVDPFCCEIKRLKRGTAIILTCEEVSDDPKEDSFFRLVGNDEAEFGEALVDAINEESGWRKPKWPIYEDLA
ncbi:hypothetical protein [Zhongshania sp.]|uniref:hypothetical protein n=1 Tax=Zhongshania sp. TaxID=1971902 RepID=UPI0035638052